jgi:hypothetical protein
MSYSIIHISCFIIGSILVILCFTTENFANAFSISWVYEDLLAYPQYKVVIYENQLIPNSSLEKFAFDDVHTVGILVLFVLVNIQSNKNLYKFIGSQ